MKKIDEWISKLNKQQKIIAAITFPLILLVSTLPIADAVAYEGRYEHGHPFGFYETWWVWLLYLVLVTCIEFKLFGKSE